MLSYEEDLHRYRLTYDIHTHTTFSHGKGSIEDNVRIALEKGLVEIGIADHGPGHLTYGVKRGGFPRMRVEIDRMQGKYPGIAITLGVEANIINPSGKLDIDRESQPELDYLLAGYHFGVFGEAPGQALRTHAANLWQVYGWGKRRSTRAAKNTELVIRALTENSVRALTHPGDKGAFDLSAIAAACAETGTLMEISNGHEAPTEEELRQIRKADVRYLISSDAHRPEKVGEFEKALRRALSAGIDPERIVNIERI